MYKILYLTHSPYVENSDQYLGTKIKNELAKYFEITQVIYFHKGNKKSIEGSISSELKYKNIGSIRKLLNLIFIYQRNIKIIKSENYDLILFGITTNVQYYFIFFYKILAKNKNFFIQTFTPSVNSSKLKRYLSDLIIALNLRLFNHIGVGFERTIKAFKLKRNQFVKIEVGVPDYGFQEKNFNKIKLLYLGTLSNREVWKSVKGLGIFIKNNPDIIIEYNIIGPGHVGEVSKLIETISESHLEDKVKYHGYLSVEEVEKFFSYSNVGVAYVPINEYYENPSTKTLEYLISGMPVIATNDIIKKEIINNDCGVLIDDNPESFAEGLEKLVNNIKHYNSQRIREMFRKNSLENTIKTGYAPKLRKIIEKNKIIH